MTPKTRQGGAPKALENQVAKKNVRTFKKYCNFWQNCGFGMILVTILAPREARARRVRRIRGLEGKKVRRIGRKEGSEVQKERKFRSSEAQKNAGDSKRRPGGSADFNISKKSNISRWKNKHFQIWIFSDCCEWWSLIQKSKTFSFFKRFETFLG